MQLAASILLPFPGEDLLRPPVVGKVSLMLRSTQVLSAHRSGLTTLRDLSDFSYQAAVFSGPYVITFPVPGLLSRLPYFRPSWALKENFDFFSCPLRQR